MLWSVAFDVYLESNLVFCTFLYSKIYYQFTLLCWTSLLVFYCLWNVIYESAFHSFVHLKAAQEERTIVILNFKFFFQKFSIRMTAKKINM